MYRRLADRIRIVSLGQKIYLVDDEISELEGCTPECVHALQLLSQGCSLTDLDRVLGPEETQVLLQALAESDLVRSTPLIAQENEIHEKQLYYLDDFSLDANAAQRNLTSATVAIIGVGGVGAIALQHFIGAGIRSFVLFEPDRVAIDNLNRQYIYHRDQVGLLKLEAAEAYVRKIDDRIRVSSYSKFIGSPEDLVVLSDHHVDLVVNAADQPQDLDLIINAYCAPKRLPFTTCAVGRHSGTWGPLVVPNTTFCMACFLREEDSAMTSEEHAVRNGLDDRIQASFGPTNSAIASLMVKDAILFLATGHEVPSLGARCAFDFEALTITRSAVATGRRCQCWGTGNHAESNRSQLSG